MKVIPLVSSLIAIAYAVPAPAEAIDQMVELKADAAAADPINPLMKSNVNGEKVLPRFSMTTFKPPLARKTTEYGPYIVSSSKMLSKIVGGKSPCSSCYVTAMEATIRYPDGKEANVDTGAWLHHIALFGQGAGGLGIWAAGNERPTLRLNSGDNKYGIDWPATYVLMIDLMSEDVKPKNLTLEISYEFVPKSTAGYRGVVMHWLTIGEPAAKAGKYSFNTLPSTVTTNGKLLYAIGHMHDGGTDMTLTVAGKVVCKSIMHYNARAGYGLAGGSDSMDMEMDNTSVKTSKGSSSKSKGSSSSSSSSSKGSSGGHSHKMVKTKRQHAHGAGGDPAQHISDPGACTNFGTVNKGDRISAVANYDANKHKLMVHNGAKEKLMGNMRVYIGPT